MMSEDEIIKQLKIQNTLLTQICVNLMALNIDDMEVNLDREEFFWFYQKGYGRVFWLVKQIIISCCDVCPYLKREKDNSLYYCEHSGFYHKDKAVLLKHCPLNSIKENCNDDVEDWNGETVVPAKSFNRFDDYIICV